LIPIRRDNPAQAVLDGLDALGQGLQAAVDVRGFMRELLDGPFNEGGLLFDPDQVLFDCVFSRVCHPRC
jgi:hypothetical protein